MIDLRHLSIQRVDGTRRPHVPDNTQRLQAFRAYQPAQYGNTMFAQRYAAEAAPVDLDDYEQDLREGFALKYHGEQA